MPVTCPVCDTDNLDTATECATCGKALASEPDLVEDVAPVPGLEQTLHDPLESGADPAPALPDLERTQLARRDLRVATEVVPDVERTPIEADPAAPMNWTGGVQIDPGREPDDGQRTPAPPEDAMCPWCHEPSLGAVCDYCGRRKSRYSVPPEAPGQAAAGDETVLCPACFGRVASGPRCSECGMPFPVVELV